MATAGGGETPAQGQQQRLERVDPIGTMLDAFPGWPHHSPVHNPAPCLDKNEREKRRRIIMLAHSKLCGDVPSLGGSLPTDYSEFLLLGGLQKTCHVTDLKGTIFHMEMNSATITRALNGATPGSGAVDPQEVIVMRKQLLGVAPPVPGPGEETLGVPGGHDIIKIFHDTWDIAFEQLNEKKVPRDENFAVQGTALAACDVILKELDKHQKAHHHQTHQGGGGGGKGGVQVRDVFSGQLKWSKEELNNRLEKLDLAMRTSGAAQRFQKRGLTTGKDEYELRLEGLAFYRTQLISMIVTFHHLASVKFGAGGGGGAAAPTNAGGTLTKDGTIVGFRSPIPVGSIGACVAESGYKSRDFALSRTALLALASCNDLNAILGLKPKLPTHFDPQGATEPDGKSTLKAAWHTSAVGYIQLWEPGTAIALGSACVKGMLLSHQEIVESVNNPARQQKKYDQQLHLPFEFVQCMAILLRHPQPQVFLAVLSEYVETLTSTSLKLCLNPDPVVYVGGLPNGGTGGEMTVLDFAFDRLLGRCSAASSSKVEILATLGMVERFADRIFSQNHAEVFGTGPGPDRSGTNNQKMLVSTSWFTNLPVTLGALWDRYPENAGIMLAAVRVWAALLLLDRCILGASKPPLPKVTAGQDAPSAPLPSDADLAAEEAANAFFQFLLYNPVFRTLHIQTNGSVIFDALDHFVTLLTHVSTHNNMSGPEVDTLLRMVFAVLLEAPFIGDVDCGTSTRRFAAKAGSGSLGGGGGIFFGAGGGDSSSSASSSSAMSLVKLTNTLKKLLNDPCLIDYKPLVLELCTELAHTADARGSQQLAIAIRLCN